MSASLTTLVSFNSTSAEEVEALNGAMPSGDLIADAKGDLFGTTSNGGANGPVGTVFEIIKTAGGYASTPTTLVSFNVTMAANPSPASSPIPTATCSGRPKTGRGALTAQCSRLPRPRPATPAHPSRLPTPETAHPQRAA